MLFRWTAARERLQIWAMGVLLSIFAVLIGISAFTGPDPTGTETPEPGVTIALDPSGNPPPPTPPVSGASDPSRPLVLIDPGHGGADPGATSPFGGVHEKDVALAIARAIRDEIAASGRVRVALTRNDDRLIDLEDRYALARRMGADLFISVHADAAPRNDAARGATIYTLSEIASSREAAELAARENGASVGGADFSEDRQVNHILIDLAQREAMSASADFARLLHREASPLFAFQPDYHRFASLMVLKAPDIPSVLFESGYLTNRDDEAFVRSAEGRKRIAAGMRRAIETYFALRAARP